jgi:hypothetical protein
MVHVPGIESCLLEVFVELGVLVDIAHRVRLPDRHPMPSEASSSDDVEMQNVVALPGGKL